jgi:fatty-acyl-CoA synthase
MDWKWGLVPGQTGVTVQNLIARALRRYADQPCIRWESGAASYAETAERAGRLAAWLADHTPGTRHVAIALPNGREYLELILACALGNLVRVPLSSKEPLDVLRAKLTESSAEVLIAPPEILDGVGDWINDSWCAALAVGDHSQFTCYDDVIAAGGALGSPAGADTDRYRLSFTGGTTGVAKAVVQTHRQERALIRNLLLEVVSPGPDRTFVAATPLAHAAGAFVLPTALRGGTMTWLDHFDPERLTDASWLGADGESGGIETFLVPTAMGDLAAAAASGRHDLACVVYGGAPCPAPVLDAALAAIGAEHLVQVYGQAEAPMTICVASHRDHAAGRVKDGWVGHPFMFVEVEIAGASADNEVGEIVVRAEHVMEGYWRRPQETSECIDGTGGLHTGDVGRLDADGGVRIVGRSRELIISGGFNVYPDDVERRLRSSTDGDIPLSVFAVTHPRWGEAVVVAAQGGGEAQEAVRSRIQAAADQALTYYERPKEIFVVDALPLTAVGKVARKELAGRYRSYFSDEAGVQAHE